MTGAPGRRAGEQPLRHPRMKRELATVKAMIRLYCRAHHGRAATLCAGCADLEGYAARRLMKCPFQEAKSTCGACPIHCYRPAMKEKILRVMRYAGPRMVFRHPILAFFHLLDTRRSRRTSGKSAGNRLIGDGDERR